MIKDAYVMREISKGNQIYEQGYKEAVESVVKSIDEAAKRGLRSTCFCPSVYWYKDELGMESYLDFYDEVKEEFKKHGYIFESTGFINGVLQKTEDICW